MVFAGRLEGIAPSDIIQIISQNRMTGTLVARCEDRTAMIVFKEGQVVEAASDAPRESLGHFLVSQGLMSGETVKSAQERLKHESDRPLGAILVEMGAISEKTLETVVFRQIGHIVHRLMSCEDGFLTFDRGEMAVKRKLNTREFFLPAGVSTEYLIMERARVVDEERRRGADRRAQPPVSTSEGVPSGEGLSAAGEPGSTGAAADMRQGFSWFRALKLPTAENLAGVAGAVVRKGKAVVGTVGDLLRYSVMPRLANALRKVRAFSPDGRALIYAGTGGVALGFALVLLTTLSHRPWGSELVITGRVVNIRATPSTATKVVTKALQGETVSLLSSAEGWYRVRTKADATGWVWGKLAKRKENSGMVFSYGMAGSGLVLIVGLALLIAGITRKRMTASDASGDSRDKG
jgi:hypothetical protein